MITTNKTGTLNTKSVTASQLATNSPILPHKMSNGGYYNLGPDMGGMGGGGVAREPPALPPRGIPRPALTREGSLTRGSGPGGKGMPPAVPPKRSSLTRSDLALFSAESVSPTANSTSTSKFCVVKIMYAVVAVVVKSIDQMIHRFEYVNLNTDLGVMRKYSEDLIL